MKPILLFSLFLGCYLTATSQTGKLTGSVMDAGTKTPLELATVSLFGEDSSLVTYQLTTKNGVFTFEELPLKKKLLVGVTYTGYTGFYKWMQLEGGKTDMLPVFLSLHFSDSNAVVVTSITPIRMNGDTLEINPAAFRMKEDAVVEELLAGVSGVVIWADGTITVNGRKVENLFVDGKPFLGSSDPRIATQNLPKSAIDKIQLYQEYDRNNIGRVKQPQDSTLTMNIKLKEGSKKGYFGKAGAGIGTRERYEGDLSLQMYNKKSSIGIGGGINNTNKSIGNLQELFQNNTYRNFNPNLYAVGQFGGGINKNRSLGGALTHSFKESASSRQQNRITVNYTASGTDASLTDLNLQSRTTLHQPQFIRDEGLRNSLSNRQILGVDYVKTNSYNDNLSLNGSYVLNHNTGVSSRLTEVRDSAGALQSTNSLLSSHGQRMKSGNLRMNFSQQIQDEPLQNYNFGLFAEQTSTASESETQSVFRSFTDRSKSTAFNRRYLSNRDLVQGGGDLFYGGFKRLVFGRYRLFGINLNLTQRINFRRETDDHTVLDYDSAAGKYVMNAGLSNRNKKEVFQYLPALSFSKDFHKSGEGFYRSLNVEASLGNDFKTDKNRSSFAKRNLDRSFSFFGYEGHVRLMHHQQNRFVYNFSANYASKFDYPSIDQLYTIVDEINVYNISIGNPYLRNSRNQNMNLHGQFHTQKPNAVYSFNGSIGGSYSRISNPVTDSIINDPSGKRMVYFTNAGQSLNGSINYNLNLSRKFKKNTLQLMYHGRYGRGTMPNYIDRLYNISETGNLSNQLTLQFSLRSVLILTLSRNGQQFDSRQTATGLASFKNRSNNTKFGIVVNHPAHFSFSSTADYFRNDNLKEPMLLWNAFASYRFLKQQGELKLSAMDLLKQYQNISNSVNPYGTSTYITNGLQQYFLLTFSYYPRKFGKREIRQRETGSYGY